MSRKTVSCAKCGQQHRGPRHVHDLHSEGCHVLIRANGMPLNVAGEYLRSQWLGGALELSGWCANCVATEIAATCPGAKPDELDRVARVVTEQQIEDAFVEGKPIHVCKILPLPIRGAERVARDLLDIGSPKPGGAS